MTIADGDAVDVVLIGAGLASAAAAVGLASAGAHVAIIPGVARPRSVDADGGVVDPLLLADAFGAAGAEAALGPAIDRVRDLQGETVPLAPVRRGFDRAALEAWALEQARLAGAIVLDGFVEDTVIPATDRHLRVQGEDGREVTASTVILCEGSDPRIAMRAGLRPDYPPEEQIHFAKTRFPSDGGPAVAPVLVTGPWRTSWGMPVQVTAVPQQAGLLVVVAARIENVMRHSRSTLEALDEALSEVALAGMLPDGARSAPGVELIAARGEWSRVRLASDGLLISPDAAGAFDPRDVERWDRALRSGMLLRDHLAPHHAKGSDPEAHESWETVARTWIEAISPRTATYHDDKVTGFIEDGPRGPRVAEPVQRLGRGIIARLRPR